MTNQAREVLKSIFWEEGKVETIAEGPYRHRIVIECSCLGRQTALFANGEYNYFAYIELFDNNGQWIKEGVGIVPVLPNGRFIMVVEQRPAQGRYLDRPMVARIAGEDVNLADFGEYSSLEFPGGAVSPNEGFKAGFLRELIEETEIENQKAIFYLRKRPVYVYGSDLALRQYFGVAYLRGLTYKEHVQSDGGLTVFALTEYEVDYNIWHGVIHSGQAALLQWAFYKEVAQNSYLGYINKLKEAGYLTVEEIQIARPK